jgi:hypothetical protein
LRSAFGICMISQKAASNLTVNGKCGTTSLTWTLEIYGLFSHSRNLTWKQSPVTIQASAHSYFIIQASVYSYFIIQASAHSYFIIQASAHSYFTIQASAHSHFTIQASAHSYSAHLFYFYLFFSVLTKGMESRKLHRLFRNEVVFRPTDQCASHLSTFIFYLKKYWGFPELRNLFPSPFFTWSAVFCFLICQSTFKAKLLRIHKRWWRITAFFQYYSLLYLDNSALWANSYFMQTYKRHKIVWLFTGIII